MAPPEGHNTIPACRIADYWLDPSKVEGDEIEIRRFDPGMYGYPADTVPQDVLRVERDRPLYRVRQFKNAIALFADGACRSNGLVNPQGSVGVCGPRGAWYNCGYLLSAHLNQTSQNAEIHSALAALKVVREIWKREFRSPKVEDRQSWTVVLVMDSSYVVRAMTEWIRKWRDNGFRNARGAPVVNAEAFQRLDNQVRRLLIYRGINIRFWHVPREHNQYADQLAAAALRR